MACLILVWWWENPGEPAPTAGLETTPKAPAGPSALTQAMPPLYEEPPQTEINARELQAVDEALFAGLRQAGVAPASVHLMVQVVPQGEVAVLEARLSQSQDARAIEQSVTAQLATTKAQGSWQTNGNQAVLSVSLHGHPSHKLRLILPGAPPPARPLPPTARPPAPGAKPRVAIVIDDLGYQLEPARRLMGLGLNLTLAVLPNSPHGRQIAEMARAKGLQVLLHLPMEARSHSAGQLGQGAVLTRMSPEEITRITEEGLRSVPGAAGVNNHMGSLFSEDPAALETVMAVLRRQGLFFLDSLTSPRSQARALASGMGLMSAQRDIFLDHQPARSAVDFQLDRLFRMARHQGRAIAIGHPHSATLEALAAMAPRLRQELDLVAVSELMQLPVPAEPDTGPLDRAAAKP